MEKYPKLEIFIDASERIPDFEREQAEIAVGFSSAPQIMLFNAAWQAHAMSCAPHQNI